MLSRVPRASPDERLVWHKTEGRRRRHKTLARNGRRNTPVSHGFLPALQLGDLIDLETKDTRAVPIGAQRDRCRVDSVAEAIGALDELVARAPTAARVVHGRACTRQDADGPPRGVR